MSGRLQGKRTLITGTASGIGRAAARLFSAEGARLTLCDRQAAENQQLADEIVSGGGIAQAIQTDVGDPDAMQAALARAVEADRVAIRNGHFYAKRLVEAVGVADADDGVVRCSMVHYNTPAEIERLIAALDKAL